MILTSRYGETWELKEISGGYLWEKIPDYTRFGFFPDSKDEICFIDPPGGPFLEIGRDIKPDEMIIGFIDEGESGVIIKTHKKEG